MTSSFTCPNSNLYTHVHVAITSNIIQQYNSINQIMKQHILVHISSLPNCTFPSISFQASKIKCTFTYTFGIHYPIYSYTHKYFNLPFTSKDKLPLLKSHGCQKCTSLLTHQTSKILP